MPCEKITSFLRQYLEHSIISADEPVSVYPKFLSLPPYRQTQFFTGRDDLIGLVTDYLLHGKSCYLHGIGGIGKTEIAKAVLKNILNIPSEESGITHILWVEYIENSFTISLVRALSPKKEDVNIERAFIEATETINRYREHLLLIIDNIEDTEDERLTGLNSYLNCRTLITSRCEGYSEFIKVPVPSLDLSDCMNLFYFYYHGSHDDSTLEKIIALTDRHTVTIELLAKIADTEETELYEFYESLVRCGFHISNEEASSVHEKLQSESRIIEQLKKLFKVYGCSPQEVTLLMQVSTIPSIPFVFSQAQRWFEIKNRTLLNILSKKGWIKKEALCSASSNRYRYVMHSVIAAAVRAQFLDTLYDVCKGFIREVTLDMQNSRDKNDAFKKDIIQFSWSLNDIFHDSFHSSDDCDFIWALADIYRDIGFYEKALPLLDSLAALYTNLYGESCIQISSVWNNKGMISYELSHFNDALAFYEKSRVILKNHITLKSESFHAEVELAKLNLNIGKTYLKVDFSKAESYFTESHEIFMRELGENSHYTMNAYAHRAILMTHAGQFQDAEKIYLEVYNKIKSEMHDRDMLLLRAGIAHNLANLYSDYAKSKVMPYLYEARDIFCKLLSPTHPDTIDVLNTIYSCELAEGIDYNKSLKDFNQLLDLFLKAYGQYDPNTGTIYNNIGLCYYYLHDYDAAIDNYRFALQIDAYSYGTNHEATAYIYNNIGGAYNDKGQPDKAISEHERALKIYAQAYPDHMNLDLAHTHADLADAYLQLGNGDKAMEHLNEAFAIYDKLLPKNAFQYLYPCSTLANLFAAMGAYDSAEEQYLHVIWLLLENGYAENSAEVTDFQNRVLEIRQMATEQS